MFSSRVFRGQIDIKQNLTKMDASYRPITEKYTKRIASGMNVLITSARLIKRMDRESKLLIK